MEDDFVFPDRPADLCDPRCELPLRCSDLVDVSGLEREDMDEFVDRTFADGFFFFFFLSFVVVGVGGVGGSMLCFCGANSRPRQTDSPEKRALVLLSAQNGSM